MPFIGGRFQRHMPSIIPELPHQTRIFEECLRRRQVHSIVLSPEAARPAEGGNAGWSRESCAEESQDPGRRLEVGHKRGIIIERDIEGGRWEDSRTNSPILLFVVPFAQESVVL